MRLWLKALRDSRGMTQAQVADRSGICESAYCLIETGKRGCSVDSAKRIASTLGFDWTRFFEEEEKSNESKTES